MKFFQLLLTALLFYSGLFAQKGMIAGRVKDEKGKPVEGATVSLLAFKDSTVIRFAVADPAGYYDFPGLNEGRYILHYTAVGFRSSYKGPLVIDVNNITIEVPAEVLIAEPISLGSVTVTARKPLIEVKPDRTIVNVDAGVTNVGATALEVLEKSPGVTVDRDGNISLKGKQGVLVMIDGKPSYLSGSDLATLLGTMNANELDQIEIMTNPPARFDAAGNSGVINIKTKKNKQKGFNGSVSLSYGQGAYPKTNNSVNLNYRNNKFNAFLNYSLNAFEGFNHLHIHRTYYEPDNKTIRSYFEQPTYMVFKGHNNNIKLGVDYSIDKKTTLGIVAGGFISPRSFKGSSSGFLKDKSAVVDSIATTSSNNSNRWNNRTLNLNMRHQFSSSEEITADFDYIGYDNTNNQMFNNQIHYPDGAIVSQNRLKGNLPSQIKIYSAKADYTRTFKKGFKLEAGFKFSVVKTDNTADYFNNSSEIWVPDYGKSNHFLYEENINAAYVNTNKQFGKWSLQAGLRYENTNYNGKQLGNPQRQDSSFDRKYNSLFPTLYISYAADSNNTFTLNSGRRIDRPAYQQLNPFLFFINEFTYEQGNPFLAPQYTYNTELSHTYKGILTTTLSYSETKAYFSQVFATNRETTIVSSGNIGRMNNIGISVSAQLNPAKWWSASITATANHLKVDGIASGTVVNTEAFNGQMNINNQFKLNKGWGFELSGFYNSRTRDGQFDIGAFGQVSAGVSKQILKSKGSIKLNVRDLFYTQVIDGEIRYGNVLENFNQSRDSRVVNLAFTYRFGKAIKETIKRNRGVSEEEQRVRAN